MSQLRAIFQLDNNSGKAIVLGKDRALFLWFEVWLWFLGRFIVDAFGTYRLSASAVLLIMRTLIKDVDDQSQSNFDNLVRNLTF